MRPKAECPTFPFGAVNASLSRDRVSHGGLEQTAAVSPLWDVEPAVLLCLPAAAARSDGGGGQLRGPAPGTVSLERPEPARAAPDLP